MGPHLNFHFPGDLLRGASPHVLPCHPYTIFGEVSVGPFFIQVVHFLIVEF